MSDEKKEDSRIITADKMRQERNNGGRQFLATKEHAAGIAASMGQMVYDQLREQHAMSMAALDQDLEAKFADIRKVIIANFTDLQTRSFSYRVRRDFVYDVEQIAAWFRTKYELVLAWLELHGLKKEAEEPEAPHGGMYVQGSATDEELHHVGAPSELPSIDEEPVGVAQTLTLS